MSNGNSGGSYLLHPAALPWLTAASQALGDPEQPPSAHSAPHFEGVRINTDLQPSSSQQHSRAISAPELGKRTAQIDELTPHQKRTLAHLHALTTVMDNAVTIPIIRRKVGLDAMLGLIPYVGEQKPQQVRGLDSWGGAAGQNSSCFIAAPLTPPRSAHPGA